MKTPLQTLIDYMEENFNLTEETRIEFKKALEADEKSRRFTTLHDSKGTPIYEGDRIGRRVYISAFDNGHFISGGIVTFENGCFVVKQEGFDYEKADLPPSTLHEWLMDDDCEVMGDKI
jgi:hypothetical protein